MKRASTLSRESASRLTGPRALSTLAMTLPLALLSGCPAPAITPVDGGTPPGDSGPVLHDAGNDAFMGHDAGTDAFAAPDAFVAPDAFAPPDGGPDAWVRTAPVFSTSERAILGTLSPMPATLHADTTNAQADVAAAATLGHALFFDARYSGPLVVASDLGAVGQTGRVACSSCHSGAVMADERSVPSDVSLGANFHTRNAPAIVNSARYQWTNWGGRFSTQWELPPVVAESGLIMNSTRLQIAHHIFDNYRTQYEAIFGAMDTAIGTDLVRFPPSGKPKAAPTSPDGPWESMTAADQAIVNRILVNYGMAIQAYMRQLISHDSNFDRFVAGSATALSVDAQWGLRVFIGDGRCVDCHSGPTLSDNLFHNLGVPQMGPHVPGTDDGRFTSIPPLLASGLNASGVYSADRPAGMTLLAGLTNPPPESTRGAFRTASLRDVAQSAPYMHDGFLATLTDVITFYDMGGMTPVSGTRDGLLLPLGLTAQERSDLLAFLNSLNTDPVPVALRTP